MKKVLYGEQYTQARLAGIMHEAWVERTGRLGNSTVYGEGYITTSTLTGELGLIVDTDSQYFGIPEPHLSRLAEVVDGDGWIDTQGE
jgi:hypothetical protein